MNQGRPVWIAEGASRRGSSHERTGAPNQDAYAVERVGACVVAAVADGHGGRRYVRSQVGSRLAVRLSMELGAELLSVRRPDASSAAHSLPGRLVPAWRAAVDEHYALHPLTAEEVEKAGDGPLDPAILYGATLIVAFAAGDVVAVAQIGDGSALGAAPQRVEHLVPGDDRLVANETTSLCLPTALADFRWGTAYFGDGSAILLSTDGYGNSFASEGWEDEVMADLVNELGAHGFEEVAGALDSWAADSAAVGGDDVTLVLLSRLPESPRRRRSAWLATGALAALAVTTATAVGLAARGATPDPRETPIMVATTPTGTSPTSSTASTASTPTGLPTTGVPATSAGATPTPSGAGTTKTKSTTSKATTTRATTTKAPGTRSTGTPTTTAPPVQSSLPSPPSPTTKPKGARS